MPPVYVHEDLIRALSPQVQRHASHPLHPLLHSERMRALTGEQFVNVLSAWCKIASYKRLLRFGGLAPTPVPGSSFPRTSWHSRFPSPVARSCTLEGGFIVTVVPTVFLAVHEQAPTRLYLHTLFLVVKVCKLFTFSNIKT